MSVRQVRTILIGYGVAGEYFHAPFLSACDGIDFLGVVVADPERSCRARSTYPGVVTWPTVSEALKVGPDLVVVATPNNTHDQLARKCLQARAHVVVDKPLATSSQVAADLIAEAHRHSRLLTAFHNRRWDSDYLTACELVKSGRLGRVHTFESRFERYRPHPTQRWKDTLSNSAGGGIAWDLGPHLIDQALHLFGPAEQVYAQLRIERTGSTADDDALIVLTHAGGVRSELHASAVAADAGMRFRIRGTDAAWVSQGMDEQEQRLRASEQPIDASWGRWRQTCGEVHTAESVEPVPAARGHYGQFYEQLVRAVNDGGPLPVEADDVVAGLRVLEAAHQSSSQGEVVALTQ